MGRMQQISEVCVEAGRKCPDLYPLPFCESAALPGCVMSKETSKEEFTYMNSHVNTATNRKAFICKEELGGPTNRQLSHSAPPWCGGRITELDTTTEQSS